MLYFGRVDSLWGLWAKVASSWGEQVITPKFNVEKFILISYDFCLYHMLALFDLL